MRKAGVALLILAAVMAVYWLLFFDARAPGTEVINLYRMSVAQNMTIMSGFLGVIGVLLLLFGDRTAGASRQADYPRSTSLFQDDRQSYRPVTAELTRNAEESFGDAIRAGDVDTISRLLRSGDIFITGTNRNGRGWLQLAAMCGNAESAKALLAAGARPEAEDKLGSTARKEAAKRTNEEVSRLLGVTQA